MGVVSLLCRGIGHVVWATGKMCYMLPRVRKYVFRISHTKLFVWPIDILVAFVYDYPEPFFACVTTQAVSLYFV